MALFQTLQADDIDAINRFITSAPIQTEGARKLRDEWIQWVDTRSAAQRNFDRPTFDEARNRRLAFELANALTDAERAEIQRVAAEGLTSEQMQGEADRRQTGGHFSGASPEGWGSLLGWGLGIAAVGFLGGAFVARRR